jgi:nitroimidazol reductase NimA-like FMN-containing flavoprotein (pyridoxamine 5'-phosphate oxidase superfamily)
MPSRKPTKTAAPISAAPAFRELTRQECDALLERNNVGRVAFSFHDHVDIEPVHYVYAGGWLHGRTAAGAKILVLRHHPWVAFEVDEVEGLFDWRSVVVHGGVHVPDPEGSPADREAHAETLGHVRRLVPETLAKDDPAPGRLLLFRIHVDEVTGRAAASRAAAPERAAAKRR